MSEQSNELSEVNTSQRLEIEEQLVVGRFLVFEGFETGVILSCRVDDGRVASISFSPSEALELATLIEAHRADLNGDIAKTVDRSVESQAPLTVVDGEARPMPIPTVKHLKGDDAAN